MVQYCCISNSHTLPFILQVLIFPNGLLQWTLKFIEKLNHSWLSTDRQSEHQLSCTLFLCKLTKPLQMLVFVCAYVILFFFLPFHCKVMGGVCKSLEKPFFQRKTLSEQKLIPVEPQCMPHLKCHNFYLVQEQNIRRAFCPFSPKKPIICLMDPSGTLCTLLPRGLVKAVKPPACSTWSLCLQ